MNDVSQRVLSHDHHTISVEVVFQLLGCNQYGVDQFLNLWVPGLGFIEYLTNEIDWSLYLLDVAGLVAFDHHGSGDHSVSCRNVKQESFVFSGSSEDRR